MSEQSESQAAARERMSALADGALDPYAVARACALWRTDADARATWHAYQVIGDVLRSDELAQEAAGDAAFMQALRTRMADEPTLLAPQSLAPQSLAPQSLAHQSFAHQPPAPQSLESHEAQRGAGSAPMQRSRRWGWMAPSAVAAGFFAVAGVLMVTRAPDSPSAAEPTVASLAAPAATAPMVSASGLLSPTPAALLSATPAALEVQAVAVNGQLIRDAQLDRYLAAHKQFAGSSALGVPSGFLRSATVDMAGR